jgi:hypothetical protein
MEFDMSSFYIRVMFGYDDIFTRLDELFDGRLFMDCNYVLSEYENIIEVKYPYIKDCRLLQDALLRGLGNMVEFVEV